MRKLLFIFLFTALPALSQPWFPVPDVRGANGPLFAFDLAKAASIDPKVKEIPNLKLLILSFDAANFFLKKADANIMIEIDLTSRYEGFVMVMPDGSERMVRFSETDIVPTERYEMGPIEMELHFSKIQVVGICRLGGISTFNGQFNTTSRDGHFVNFDEQNGTRLSDFKDDYFKNRDNPDWEDMIRQLQPYIVITNPGSFHNAGWGDFGTYFSLGPIKKYIEGVHKAELERLEKEKLDTLKAEAELLEQNGRIEEALAQYEKHFELSKDPEILEKIKELKDQLAKANVANASNEQGGAGLNSETAGGEQVGEGGTAGEGKAAKETSADNNTTVITTTTLDYWGNPVTTTTIVSNANGVGEKNTNALEQYQIDQSNARQQAIVDYEQREAQRRTEIDSRNNAIVQQANSIYQNSKQLETQFEQAKSKLDYGSGDALLNSSANLARNATNVADAKTGLAGMGVGLLLKIGENAAKQRAAEEASAERERQRKAEEAREKAAKEALAELRRKLFDSYPPGDLPTSASKSIGLNLYYFAYSYDEKTFMQERPKVTVSDVFVIGKYPDNTWPMRTKIEQEVSAMTALEEVICGPFYTLNEAQTVHNGFLGYLGNARMSVTQVPMVSFNERSEQGSTTTPQVDFWGNPIKKSN